MSKSLNSPTARLLRSSRLFSLPPPLPAAPLEALSSSGVLRSSDTATLPYPTHQAISTPSSSRHRGDWGLKRPLPDRQIPKSNPHLRIKAIDNLNHITEFASAADHTQTVQKWQEINMPLTMASRREGVTRSSRTSPISAFEAAVDNTAFASSSAKDLDSISISAERAILLRGLSSEENRQRWKTEGPWVNGLTEREFQQYLDRTVRKHKAGFLNFLERVRIDQKKQDLTQRMRDEGLLSDLDPKAFELELEQQSRLDEHELGDYTKQLRDTNIGLSSELSRLVCQYFDLPQFPVSEAAVANESSKKDASKDILTQFLAEEPSTETPPATHPSAGLSYIRTRAFMENHPLYGPQASHEPVQARVIKPRSAIGAGNDRKANLGVAGFVTEESGYSSFASKTNTDNMSPEQRYIHNVSYLDPDTPGGNKVWVNPTKAHVDEKGYIQLTVDRADEQAVGVKTGNPIEAPSPNISSRYGTGRLDGYLDARQPAGTRANANFGKALPDTRVPAASSAQPFDVAELNNARRGEKTATADMDSMDQIKMIEQLARQHLEEHKK